MTPAAKGKLSIVAVEALPSQDRDAFKQLRRESLQEVLAAEMTELLGAECGQRTDARSGCRASCYSRSLATRIGELALRVPRDRERRLSTELFWRYQRLEKRTRLGAGRDVGTAHVHPKGQGRD